MRLAHLSDPHLLSLAGTRLRDFVNKRWIGALNLLANRAREHKVEVFDAMVADINALGIDHVLCTGDITNVALPSEFEFARGRFDRLDFGAADATIIPGNHDAYVHAGVPLFADYFGDNFACDPGWEWPDRDPWPTVRVRGDVAIVGVTTSLETPWFTAWGRLGAKQIGRLAQVLDDDRLAGTFKLVAIHHPPVGPKAEHDRHGLKDHRQFCRVVASAGADLVVHGHEHLDMRNELRGRNGTRIPVHGIQSATYAGLRRKHRAHYRVYTLGPGVLTHELRAWNPDAGRFESASARSST
jgi:3',5'-cyclic AMP phosphodiesterase CpdA